MVIPIHDRNPTRRPAVVTWTLIAINVVAFLVSPAALITPMTGTSTAQVCADLRFNLQWGAVPRELLSNQASRDTAGPPAGPNSCIRVRRTESKYPVLSAFTAMFVHGGWLHLLGNMLFLFVFGNNVEDRLGRVRYLIFYLLVGGIASYGFALASPSSTTPLVGASGAIAGVLGAYLILFPRARVTSLVPFLFFIPLPLPAWLVLGSWFLLQWAYAAGLAGVSGSGGGVAYLAHVIGFAVGALYILFLGHRFREPPPQRFATYGPGYGPY